MVYKLGDLLEQITETNSDLKYGLDDIVGVTINKEMIPTIANLNNTDLSKFNIIRKHDFIYNPRTHGKKIGLGYNKENRNFISTWNNNSFRIKNDKKNIINPDYLYLYFCGDNWDKEACFNAWGSSTVVLLWENFCNMTIDLPDINIQNKIVEQYNIIIDRIKVLNELNDELFHLLQTNFKYFIHSTDSLCHYTLSDFCDFQEGYVNPPQENTEYFDGNIKWLRAGDVNESYIISTERTLTEKGFKSAKKSAILFKPHTFAITKSGVIGRLGIIDDYMCGNRAVINIIPKDKRYFSFVYLILREKQEEMIQLATGSAQKNLYVSMLESIEFDAPIIEEIGTFNNKVIRIFNKIELNCKEKYNLEKIIKGYFYNII